MVKLMGLVRWIQKESKNSRTQYPATRTMVKELITSHASCLYLDNMYYNNTLNISYCVSCFLAHMKDNIWSFYTLHLLMDINDIPYVTILQISKS